MQGAITLGSVFLTGWKATGGESPSPQKIFELIHCGAADSRVNKPDTTTE